MFFKKIDLSHASRVFVVGDIHGMFSLLETRLEEIGFDKEYDILLSVGDLVDRGPESHRALEFAKYPWFIFVKGNHEQLVDFHLNHNAAYHHIINGGKWFESLSLDEQMETCNVLNDAPVIIEALLPSGKRIGIVHADFPSNDWNDISTDNKERWTEYCLWARDRVFQHNSQPIRNIDHVYFGHTILDNILTKENCTWIDTGAFCTNILTIVEVT